MYERPFQSSDSPYQPGEPPYGDYPWGGRHRGRRHGIVRTAAMWVLIALAVILAFGTVAWALGLVFHLAVFLLKIALVTAVVAFVWRRIVRRRPRSYDV